MAIAKAKWSDLGRRLTSTVILIAIGAALALSTGLVLRVFVSVLAAVTFWELARMTGWRHPRLHHTLFGRARPIALATLAGLGLFLALMMDGWMAAVGIALPIVAGLPGAVSRDRITYAAFGSAILLVAYGLVVLREGFGLGYVLWVIGIVVISDILGYFAGKMIGGKKFWPAISPNKTWAGTIAGWVGAAVFGLILWLADFGPAELIIVSPFIAFAGQMGDIAESWLKRRAGVKDSSNLIPGHGGLMDRLDAICGATLFVLGLGLFFDIPVMVS